MADLVDVVRSLDTSLVAYDTASVTSLPAIEDVVLAIVLATGSGLVFCCWLQCGMSVSFESGELLYIWSRSMFSLGLHPVQSYAPCHSGFHGGIVNN